MTNEETTSLVVQGDADADLVVRPMSDLERFALQQQTGVLMDPEGMAIIEDLAKKSAQVRRLAIYSTQPFDWVLSKDQEGRRSAFPNINACRSIARIFQVQLYRPTPVQIETDEDGRQIGSAGADGFSLTTGQIVQGVIVNKIGGKNKFAGRDPAEVGTIDLKQATRSALEAKVIKILCNVGRVTIEELAKVWELTVDDVEKNCTKGQGYGKSKDRSQDRSDRAKPTDKISDAQRRFIWGKTFGALKASGHPEEPKEDFQAEAGKAIESYKVEHGLESMNDLQRKDVDAVVKYVEEFWKAS